MEVNTAPEFAEAQSFRHSHLFEIVLNWPWRLIPPVLERFCFRSGSASEGCRFILRQSETTYGTVCVLSP